MLMASAVAAGSLRCATCPPPLEPVGELAAGSPVGYRRICELFPEWPPGAARADPAQLEICVGLDGLVSSVEVQHSTGDQNLDGRLVSSARRWIYEPQKRNGAPVPFCHPIVIEYNRGKRRRPL